MTSKRKIQTLSTEEVQQRLADSYLDFFSPCDEKDFDDKHIIDEDFDLTDTDLSCIRQSAVRG